MKINSVTDDEKLDALPKRESVKPSEWDKDWRGAPKITINWLVRTLGNSTGRPWNKVQSEILHAFKHGGKHLPVDCGSEQRLIELHVETSLIQDERGRLWRMAGNGPPTEYSHYGKDFFYVDRAGILRSGQGRNARMMAPPRLEEKWYVRIGPRHDLQKRDGIWYDVQWVPVAFGDRIYGYTGLGGHWNTDKSPITAKHGALSEEKVCIPSRSARMPKSMCDFNGAHYKVTWSKCVMKQLSTDELRRYDLVNDRAPVKKAA